MLLTNLVATPPHKWRPISDLPSDPGRLASSELKVLQQIWIEQKDSLEATGAVKEFNEQLSAALMRASFRLPLRTRILNWSHKSSKIKN
jgi:hypothetical protein